ncbi:MAG: antibiotic biosynthesis monooxygenase [Planctomycetia bacterium]|nr:antibiotic biosynthesis monooxygenase [Planctomycetia bacterium]
MSDPSPSQLSSCYAVIFSSQRTVVDAAGYATMAGEMDRLARLQPGFLGIESTRGADGFGITISYWDSEAAIRNWGRHVEHLVAQDLGREKWYATYRLRVAKIERERQFKASASQ